MSDELNVIIVQAVQNLVKTCNQTARKVQSSQMDFEKTLANLNAQLNILRELTGEVDNTKISTATSKIENHTVRFQRLQKRVQAINERVTIIERSLQQTK